MKSPFISIAAEAYIIADSILTYEYYFRRDDIQTYTVCTEALKKCDEKELERLYIEMGGLRTRLISMGNIIHKKKYKRAISGLKNFLNDLLYQRKRGGRLLL